ncbi:MAG: HEAT repeat domain-containing protein, partial [Myxococcota bacterium]
MTDAEERQTLSQISRHTTRFGRIATALLVGGAIVLGALWYWQELQDQEMEARLDAIAEMDDVEQIKSDLRAMLPETSDRDLRWRIVKNMGHFKDEQAMPLLVEELDSAGRIRRAAAWAIAEIGPPAADAAKPRLLEVLPKTDERDRAQVVWTLALLGASEASDAILEAFSQGMLQSLEGFDPKIIADVLGPEQLASDKLINHPEESVRVLTAHALAESKDAEVIVP